ncbi:C4-dicarboxylate ABC transporter permease [Mesobacillus campisalis]|uniref:C4-dicarboxylate ABC transporter permease n=1 Tax=Mesobacillus campisalis TaxID=1408103 RepID=A0A0M2SVY4_9BACI|nr:TRAP transporter small permease [Mesobacillus campisalis]KKK36805.1 C4-dicarboxylate ABC transporter permease [Mesobacillus campisalis]
MLKTAANILNKFLNGTIALSLAFMSLLVFGNVILRYAFNSGITWSEEMSRFLFVWMVFLGAIAALKDNMHLGVDIVTNALPPKLRKIAYVISNLLVLYVLYLLLVGSWKMTLLNMNSTAPATGLPLSYLYGIGILTSLSMAGIIIIRMVQNLMGKEDANLTMVSTTDEIIKGELQAQELNKQTNIQSGKISG